MTCTSGADCRFSLLTRIGVPLLYLVVVLLLIFL